MSRCMAHNLRMFPGNLRWDIVRPQSHPKEHVNAYPAADGQKFGFTQNVSSNIIWCESK